MTVARVRAALIALVLLVHGVCVLPVPANISPKAFDNATGREELRRWSGLLAHVGIEVEPKALGDGVLERGQVFADAKKAFLKPFRPVLRATGTGQAWGLFTYPVTHPNRLHISWRPSDDAPWILLYRALDPEYDWHEATFRYRRIRGVYDDNASKVRASYTNFCEWVARDVFAEIPEAQQIRVHMVQTVTRTPREKPDDLHKVRLVRVLDRPEGEDSP